MKKLKFLLTLLFLNLGTLHSLSGEVTTSFGMWDWQHYSNRGTGAYALNFDYLQDEENRNINLPLFGSVKKIYSLTMYADINDSFRQKFSSKASDNRAELGGFISAGLEKDFKLFDNLIISPSFSPSLYGNIFDGKSMGLPLEFKSQIKFKYNFGDNSNFSFSYNHLSNANIGSWNPGSDTILFSFKVSEVF